MKAQENQPALETTSTQPAGLGRRLGAIFYDLMAVIAIVLFAAVPFVLITGDTSKHFFIKIIFQTYLLGVIFLYYAYSWIRRGQTLGLLSWRLKLIASDGGEITWMHTLKRFSAAIFSTVCLGLGFLWTWIDRDKLAWHDRWSGTRLVRLMPAPIVEKSDSQTPRVD